jgi:hypothetical protein
MANKNNNNYLALEKMYKEHTRNDYLNECKKEMVG